jgi:putative toxin-antitoxin system antitoxin component (TIGR02293 family)
MSIKPYIQSLPSSHPALEDVDYAHAYYNRSILKSDGKVFTWRNRAERIQLIRKGVPYASFEVLGQRMNKPVKAVLTMVGMAQTTYNKKKSEHSLLDSRNSELVLFIIELMDYGLYVFNAEEDKFNRWLEKANSSLNGNSPLSLLDTITGIEEVKACLDRMEYGNFS